MEDLQGRTGIRPTVKDTIGRGVQRHPDPEETSNIEQLLSAPSRVGSTVRELSKQGNLTSPVPGDQRRTWRRPLTAYLKIRPRVHTPFCWRRAGGRRCSLPDTASSGLSRTRLSRSGSGANHTGQVDPLTLIEEELGQAHRLVSIRAHCPASTAKRGRLHRIRRRPLLRAGATAGKRPAGVARMAGDILLRTTPMLVPVDHVSHKIKVVSHVEPGRRERGGARHTASTVTPYRAAGRAAGQAPSDGAPRCARPG